MDSLEPPLTSLKTPVWLATQNSKFRSFSSATRSGPIISYRDSKKALKSLQNDRFAPLLRLLTEKHCFPLSVTESLFEEPNKDCLGRLNDLLAQLSPKALLTLEVSCGLLKSFGLSLLMLSDDISAKEALTASRLEDIFQYEAYGYVEDFHLFEETELYMKLLTTRLFWKSLL